MEDKDKELVEIVDFLMDNFNSTIELGRGLANYIYLRDSSYRKGLVARNIPFIEIKPSDECIKGGVSIDVANLTKSQMDYILKQ